MGYYINPKNMTKEDFLDQYGTEVGEDTKWEDVPEHQIPVVLVDNGWMTAAAIGYKKEEFEHFLDPSDTRPKQIFLVKISDVIAVPNDDFTSYAKANGLIAA